MKHFTTIKEISTYLKPGQKQGLEIGFVPTMGALHEGHLTLIRRSKAENDLTICSIFVNPIQFNNKEDLEKYPRNLVRDAKILEELGCDVLFSPESGEIYPDGHTEPLDLEFGMLDKVMEGKFRPGHFRGVAIVVKKLFDIVYPSRAYFGKKDFQQLAIIRYLVQTLKIPVQIIACETVREDDGLAMSSRNMRLTIAERQIAPIIYQVLCKAKEKVGKLPVWELKEWAIKKIQTNPEMRVEYFEIGDRESLLPLENWSHKNRAVAFTAVFLGDVRLIDNIELFS
ncbi:MAG: pantoate--beta-alanine ligase [Bacteroidales bacterium]|jgi:pantoate--beta-alanine ligase|nr:pantoate--beta-alanine ligase [Bacteroidales bacterium]